MQNTVTSANACQQSGIEKIIEILNKDLIFIPKAVMVREDVYEESKMMFSVIFTECLHNFSQDSGIVISRAMKERLYAMTDTEIQLDSFCTKSKVEIVKSEVLHLINHTNIASCVREVRGEVI